MDINSTPLHLCSDKVLCCKVLSVCSINAAGLPINSPVRLSRLMPAEGCGVVAKRSCPKAGKAAGVLD